MGIKKKFHPCKKIDSLLQPKQLFNLFSSKVVGILILMMVMMISFYLVMVMVMVIGDGDGDDDCVVIDWLSTFNV